MSTPRRAPRSRSPFAAAFLSLVFPGLGHAYAGAWSRALGFAAAPLLLLALLGGIVLRVDRFDLLGFVIQPEVLFGLLVANLVLLVYRIIAAVDAWQVARFLNAAEVSGGGRLGRARLPLNPLSAAGLLAVILVMAGGHVVVAHYNVLALDLVNCVFTDSGNATCDEPASGNPDESPGGSPGDVASAGPGGSPSPSTDALPTPISTSATGTQAPTLPPWDGKGKLNVLMVGVDQRPNQGTFNTDTMIVVSVDPQTKQVAMFQIPRDTVDVPVPANARSVWGSVYRGKINSWFLQNRNRSDLWPGKTTQARGFAALKAILGELYGIQIPYYVMVNFNGFRSAVDTLGGVQVNVQIPVAESDYPVGGGVVTRIYIPAGPQHMTGGQALIYARSRHRAVGGDFDRGRRQQRVLLSLKEQMNAQAILANLNALAKDIGEAVKTDVRTSEVPKLLSLADSIDTRTSGPTCSRPRSTPRTAMTTGATSSNPMSAASARPSARRSRSARTCSTCATGWAPRKRACGCSTDRAGPGSPPTTPTTWPTTGSTPPRPTRRRARWPRPGSSSTTGPRPTCPRRSSSSSGCTRSRSRRPPTPR